MFEKLEFFEQAIRFSPFWMGVDLLLIFHFFYSWAKSAKQTGWKLDFWTYHLIIYIFIPVFFMYPFAASIFNFVATGSGYEKLEGYVDQAFAIICVGYVFMWVGRLFYDSYREKIPLYALCHFFSPFEKLVDKNIRHKNSIHLLFWISCFLSGMIFFITFKEGYLLQPRAYFLQKDMLRPLFNFTVILMPLTMGFLGLRALAFKEKRSRFFLICLLLFSLLFGLRGVTITGLMTVFLYWVFSKQGRVSLLKMGSCAFGLLILFLSMDALRKEDFNLWSSLFSFFYGNHFSDTRDFAWILSCWDENYLYGKSYIAGILSFVPRFLSSYRQEWSFNLVTNDFIGLDSSEHAGLRPTIFGEAFLNFGYLGVIALGFVAGYFLRHADRRVKEVMADSQNVIKAYTQTLVFMAISCLFITVGIWGFYLFALIHLLFSVSRRALTR